MRPNSSLEHSNPSISISVAGSARATTWTSALWRKELRPNLAVAIAKTHVGDEHGQLDDVGQGAPGFVHDCR
jgi:hypothetical protein